MLKNRFSEEVKYNWMWWYSCMICGMNQWDALHHIISPVSEFYIPGKHNESILNSCPIHNCKCHIGKDGYLHKKIPELLNKTYNALTINLKYKLTKNDKIFLEVYKKLYDKQRINDKQ